MPTQEEMAAKDCGPEPTAYEETIKKYFERTLKDSESARYRFSKPTKVVLRDAPLFGGKLRWGWVVTAEVNAKNSYGAYTGYQAYNFMFRDGRMDGYMSDGLWTQF